MKQEQFIPVDLNIPTVKIVMREVNGLELLFTSDGKLIAGQVDAGHTHYLNIGEKGREERKKCFRATFMFGKEFHGGEPLEV